MIAYLAHSLLKNQMHKKESLYSWIPRTLHTSFITLFHGQFLPKILFSFPKIIIYDLKTYLENIVHFVKKFGLGREGEAVLLHKKSILLQSFTKTTAIIHLMSILTGCCFCYFKSSFSLKDHQSALQFWKSPFSYGHFVRK